MAGRRTCRGTAAACADGTQGNAVEEREGQTMPMCRHVHPIPTHAGCRSIERQLCDIQQLMCAQNRLLSELLQAMRERNG